MAGPKRTAQRQLEHQQADEHQLANLNPAELQDLVEKLKFFLATAPGSFADNSNVTKAPRQNANDEIEDTDDEEEDAAAEDEDETARCFRKFQLPNGESVSCVLWNGLYHITGTDIVKAIAFRFLAFGRPVRSLKKFEEGVFSDLRNLKPGTDATLEEPKVSVATLHRLVTNIIIAV